LPDADTDAEPDAETPAVAPACCFLPPLPLPSPFPWPCPFPASAEPPNAARARPSTNMLRRPTIRFVISISPLFEECF
jgi:hypothetical protein